MLNFFEKTRQELRNGAVHGEFKSDSKRNRNPVNFLSTVAEKVDNGLNGNGFKSKNEIADENIKETAQAAAIGGLVCAGVMLVGWGIYKLGQGIARRFASNQQPEAHVKPKR
ncbi:MAG: hypothetical protein JSR17_11560 [Proteobacteria bacterium]|nr:hypothetical protein [Pseudomonadota bacterium]